jgi:uncharacterized protein involved in exopolysaccharide biosynthesis
MSLVNKTAAYRDTFRKHRRLLSLPIVLAVLIAAWTALGNPKSYASTASLWVDNPAGSDSSLGNLNPALLPPSQQEQQVVTELLATRAFVRSVARQSGLARYLATHSSGGFGPSALLSSLSGAGSLDNRVAAALSPSSVTTAVRGPQVLELSYAGPTAVIAARTLQAILSELQQESTLFATQHNEGALAYDRTQVQSASRSVATARDQLHAYLAKHPNAGSGDPTLMALQTAQSVVNSQLSQANTNLTAEATAAKGGGASGSAARVLDAPSIAAGPTSGKKKQLIAIVGGLFAGLLISLLGVVALTPSRPVRWEDEEPDLDPVASVTPANGAEPARHTNGTSVKNGNGSGVPMKKLATASRMFVRSRSPAGESHRS